MKNLLVNIQYRLLNLLYIIFPVLAGVTFLALIFDIYKYLGFFKKHLFVDSLTLLNLLMCLGLIISIFPAKKSIILVSKLERIFERLNIVFFPLLVILYIYFNNMLTKNGLNYVFSKYHIQPQNLPLLIFFNAFVLFMYLYRQIPDKTV